MRFAIVKCHGSGNDFPMIDARALSLDADVWAGVARALADRRGPVGGDGLLLLVPGDARAAFGMVMRNSDGSEAETCLNGVRCVARAGFEALGIEAATVRLKTSYADAVRDADLAPGVYTVRETAGPAGLSTAAWPIHGAPETLVDAVLPMLDAERRFTAVTMPNPHLVHFVETTVDEDELIRLGAVCEAAPAWLPNRANVSFVAMRGDSLFVRTFERGVGLTDSCGSAMAASTYAACLTGRIAWDRPTVVFNRGGLVRAFAGEDGMVTLSGNATYEWAGSVEVDLASETARDLVIDRHFADEIAAWDAAKRG
ncbi:diaminopimelate epimerase [Sphingomonas fuzhouensis]|uniref:diaminopimelate epimerase n=1 Tax=Sphingomonas fuzhouensis TaxID=3106033 RepID=UPI002AFF21CD|nr:diaminopimelate epimerase [Sphingomonas sp. SGZ-02]